MADNNSAPSTTRHPSAQIDMATRLVQVTQPHPVLVNNEQKVTIPFAALKQLLGQILMMEAQAEAMTGDPRALPQ
jgi:hypothetical protein